MTLDLRCVDCASSSRDHSSSRASITSTIVLWYISTRRVSQGQLSSKNWTLGAFLRVARSLVKISKQSWSHSQSISHMVYQVQLERALHSHDYLRTPSFSSPFLLHFCHDLSVPSHQATKASVQFIGAPLPVALKNWLAVKTTIKRSCRSPRLSKLTVSTELGRTFGPLTWFHRRWHCC